MPAHRRLVWSPRSKTDLQEILRYFSRVASPDLADKILREIDQSARKLPDHPFQFRKRDEVLPGLRSVLVQPYTVFYRVSDDAVEIVRVIHERRNFPAVLSNQSDS